MVLPTSGSTSSQLHIVQERPSWSREEVQDRLTRLDLSSSRLPAISPGPAVILEGSEGGKGAAGEGAGRGAAGESVGGINETTQIGEQKIAVQKG